MHGGKVSEVSEGLRDEQNISFYTIDIILKHCDSDKFIFLKGWNGIKIQSF